MRALALLLFSLAVTVSLARDPCADDQSCIPTFDDYTINADEADVVEPMSKKYWVKCRGDFALCAFAKCKVMPETADPPLVECGCFEPIEEGMRSTWFVTPRQLKSGALYELTSDYCYEGDAFNNTNTGCTETNSAPVCAGILENWIYGGNYELISTFTPTKEMAHTQCIGPGTMAECMSAACYRKEAFDGSPVTCYCPLVNVPAGQKYGLGWRRSTNTPVSCDQPDGYTISGEYTADMGLGVGEDDEEDGQDDADDDGEDDANVDGEDDADDNGEDDAKDDGEDDADDDGEDGANGA